VIYYFNFECFIVNQSIPKNLFTSIYFSLSTFSSFGLGELIPRTNGMQFYVMLEILIGYFILGIFVILITRKLDLKY
jgi:CBS domain containing-hemolysin-like protein